MYSNQLLAQNEQSEQSTGCFWQRHVPWAMALMHGKAPPHHCINSYLVLGQGSLLLRIRQNGIVFLLKP